VVGSQVGNRGGATTRIFFAADIHGSQITFRKFLAAAGFYGVDALVFGGDLMGKVLVPIVRRNGGFHATFQGREEEFDADGLEAFTRAVEQPGFYWKVFEPDEYESVEADPLAKHGLFHELASARLAEWIALAEDRLRGTDVRLYMTGGNDDEPAVLETLDRHEGEHVVASEGRLVELDGEHTMITVGLSTFTPWDTPREASEEEIDTCLKLEVRPGELPRPIREAGRFVTTGGGSLAVREAIERYQPLVGLHGHIHESGGRFRIGRTQTFNPGSEYVQGVLQGVIVTLKRGKLASYQHTQG
jgi:Icc-related predicted phosphoesterase